MDGHTGGGRKSNQSNGQVPSQRSRRPQSGRTNRPQTAGAHALRSNKLRMANIQNRPSFEADMAIQSQSSCMMNLSRGESSHLRRAQTARTRKKDENTNSIFTEKSSAVKWFSRAPFKYPLRQKGKDAGTLAKVKEIRGILRQRYKGKASLRGVFLSWDANRDGLVDEEELAQIMGACGCPLSVGQAHDICKVVGGKEDATIPYDRFIDLVFENEKAVAPASMDAEVTKLVTKLKSLGMTDSDIAEAQRRRKCNQLWTLEAVLVRLRERYKQKTSLSREFRMVDVNKDGFVSKDELHGLLYRMGYSVQSQEIDELFMRIDDSGDDKVQYSEFIDVVFPVVEAESTYVQGLRVPDAKEKLVKKLLRPKSPIAKNVMEHISLNNDPNHAYRDEYELVSVNHGEHTQDSFDVDASTVKHGWVGEQTIQTQDQESRREDDLNGIKIISSQTESIQNDRDTDVFGVPATSRSRPKTRRQQRKSDARSGQWKGKAPEGMDKALRAANLKSKVGAILREKLNGDSRKGFQMFDRDGDGQILHSEFKWALSQMGVGVDIFEAELLLNYMDIDNSGFVSYDEFSQLIECPLVGSISTQELRTIEDTQMAQRDRCGGGATTANIGGGGHTASAETIKLAKKTKMQRYLFPQQDVNRCRSTPDLFKSVRPRSERFVVSELDRVTLGPTRHGCRPSHSTKNLLLGGHNTHASQWKQESRQYGAKMNETPERIDRIRREQQRHNKIERTRRMGGAHRESSPPRYMDQVRVDERRLRTLVQQRLGYYESLQSRLDANGK